MSLKRVIYFLLLLFLFLLPWQARVVYAPAFINGQFWEYGSGSWYATEAFLWVIILLSALDRFRQKSFWALVTSREHFQQHWPQLFFLVGVLLYALWQILRSTSPTISYQWLFHLLEGLCLLIIIAEQKGDGRGLLVAFWAGGVGQGILGAWQFFSQAVTHIPGFGIAPQTAARIGSFVVETSTERWLRAYGSFGSPNILGGYLALVFIIGLLLYLKSTLRQKVFFTAGQMVVLTGLVLSFSRGAWVAALTGVAVAVAVVLSKAPARLNDISRSGGKDLPFTPLNDRSKAQAEDSSPHKGALNDILKQLFFCLLIILTLFFTLHPLFATRFTPSTRLEARSLEERAGQYRDALPLIREHWFMGAGPGAYTAALAKKHPSWPVWNIQPAHNIYLLLFAELGVVGFVLFFWWCVFVVRRTLGQRRYWLPVLFTLAALGLFDHWLMSLYVGAMVWWAIFGLGLL
ncbi:MAG: O-antigen ligase family protein [Candidatus Magasanikbacteria bacterium]|nr:O-antigen ligase family protein [Candidatus Magasanikbacteria bacterium]